jgi:putative membrane protein
MEQPRATDTLANERTFLAYARTALAFIAFGFVIARFALFTREVAIVAHIKNTSPAISSVFGMIMAFAGIVCAVYGAYRYVATARALRAGVNAVMPEGSAVAIAGTIGIIGFVVVWALLAVR